MNVKVSKKLILTVIILVIVLVPTIILLKSIFFQIKADPNAQIKYPTAVNLEVKSTNQMLDSVNNRKPFSQKDEAARTALTTVANPLKENDAYTIEYIAPLDEFTVVIKSQDIEQAKADAKAWFETQGISDEGICHLPVVFSLDASAQEQFRGTNYNFNPLPPGC